MTDIREEFSAYYYAPKDIRGFLQIEDLESLQYPLSLLSFEKVYDEHYQEKYNNHTYIARNLLYELLEKEYDLCDTFDCYKTFPLLPSQITQEPNRKGEVILRAKLNEGCALSKSMKEHFNTFFDSINRDSASSVMLTYTGKDDYRLYYINYLDAIVFSLLFIYQDGRNYSEFLSDKKPFPRFRKENSCSLFSYKAAMNQVLSLYDELNEKIFSYEDFAYYLVQTYKIDKVFKFFKLNSMNIAREKMKQEYELQYICDHFKLKYREIISLEKTIEDKIFRDPEFIRYCLETDFYDPMLVFTTIFKAYLNQVDMMQKYSQEEYDDSSLSFKGSSDMTDILKNMTFLEFVEFCKDKTKRYIDEVIINLEKEIKNRKKEIQVNSISPLNIEYWTQYYLDKEKNLDKYAKTAFYGISENEYIDFLANKVIEDLPKSFYK